MANRSVSIGSSWTISGLERPAIAPRRPCPPLRFRLEISIEGT
jgi:hypothetical protein